jgi:predicted nucleic acid-binding protein
VVFDTSAIFAALTSESGASRQLLYSAYRREIQAITCDYIIDEATRNLSRKAPTVIPFLEQIFAVIDWQMVELPDALVLDVSRIVEGKDAPVIAAAIAAGHATIVTFDRRHLLNLADVIAATFGVRVVEPGIVLREITTPKRG